MTAPILPSGVSRAEFPRTHLLSKSTYMRGAQCPKALSLYTHRRELMAPVSAAQQAVFDTGNDVGVLAQSLFPGGVDLRPESARDFRDSLARTTAAIASGATVLYEAAFVHDDVLAAVDLLVRDERGWHAYEVKSTGRVKQQHIEDATLQYHVLTSVGLALSDVSIVHLNPQYVRRGDLDVAALFTTTSIHQEVRAGLGGVPVRIAALKAIVLSPDEPVVAIGKHCSTPYPCAFQAHCWQHVPDQVRGPRQVDAVSLQRFLGDLQYPLHFLDFETFNSAIPLFDGTRPYGQVPFQFSVHHQASPGAPTTHTGFLADGQGDPREAFIEALLNAIGPVGDVIAYNLPFESARLRELGEQFPAYQPALEALRARGKDLLIPFRSGWYYEPAMGMSNSIKSVLPALVPDLRYDGMTIADGETASRQFVQLLGGQFAGDIAQLRADLLAYCALDTLAMVRILGVLENAVSHASTLTT